MAKKTKKHTFPDSMFMTHDDTDGDDFYNASKTVEEAVNCLCDEGEISEVAEYALVSVRKGKTKVIFEDE